jgi:hypothetical protein
VRESLPAPGRQWISTNGSAVAMSSRAVLRIAAISGAVVALVAAGRPALAAPVPEIPPEVAAAFAGEALRQAQAGAEGVEADFSGAVRAGDDVLGILWVAKPEGGPAECAGAPADVMLGSALETVAVTEILIVDEPNGAYYALDGTTVRPLNDWARKALPQPADISALQDTVAEQYALMRGQPTEDYEDPSGVTISLVALASALALGVLVMLQRRRLRAG